METYFRFISLLMMFAPISLFAISTAMAQLAELLQIRTSLPAAFKHAYISVNDQCIHYVIGGRGEPLLPIHD